MTTVAKTGLFLLLILVLAAILQPTDENRAMSQEPAAASALRFSVFPAQVLFQAGGSSTSGSPTPREFGFFNDLSGPSGAPSTSSAMLPPQFKSANPQINGYRFIIYLPDGPMSAVTDPSPAPRHFSASAATLRQTYWVAYAYPADGDQGRRIFAIDQSGLLWSQLMHPPISVATPTWNTLYGDQGWGSTPTKPWVPYRR
jgi:hypothetical protein